MCDLRVEVGLHWPSDKPTVCEWGVYFTGKPRRYLKPKDYSLLTLSSHLSPSFFLQGVNAFLAWADEKRLMGLE